MKKIFALLVLFTTLSNAQYSIKGTMTPPEKSDWVALYKIEGAKQKFIAHTKIKNETVNIGGENQKLGKFEFILPKNAKLGSYRAMYRETGAGFIDFFFNKEDIEMVFNPVYPEQSIVYTKSNENKVYAEYIDAQAYSQKKIDSIQINYLKTKSKETKKAYKKEIERLEETQKIYEKKSQGMYVHDFIKSSKIDNASNPLEETKFYLNSVVENYFNNVEFKNDKIASSPFLINKISDYIFYLNTGDTQSLQQKLYKESITKVMSKTSNNETLKSFSEYLISAFTDKRNSEIVDWIIADYYNKLPNRDEAFKSKKLEALKVSVGRKAPDFSWKENGKNLKLSTLNDGEKYLLIFWSTQCSHCVKEIPEVYKLMSNYKDVSVIAFAIEENDLDFNSWKTNKLYNWHNVLGTNPGGNKFENKVVRDYLIDATPTYFVLDKSKKIIAVPDNAKDVKDYFEKK